MPSGDIISVRCGEASTWQCRQTWLQSLVMLTCSVSIDSGGRSMPLRRSCASKSYFDFSRTSLQLNDGAQSTSFFRWFCICTECTSVMPACMTAATCTASIICSGLAPVSRHCVV